MPSPYLKAQYAKSEQNESPAEEAKASPSEEAGEYEPATMSDAESTHHAKVQEHIGKALAMHRKGSHKAVKVHLKLIQHHHAAAMKEAGMNDEEQHESGGQQNTTPGGQPEAAYEMGDAGDTQ